LIDALLVRRENLEAQMASLVEGSPWEQQVARLRCLRGIDTLSVLGLCAEVGDFARFERPAQLMSYLGLVPSENTTGEKRRQGAITKSGSRHARRLLVEAAWHYRRAPRKGRVLQRRQEGQPQAVCAISCKAQQRLYRSWVRLDSERGKRRHALRGRRGP
jgi:transposase